MKKTQTDKLEIIKTLSNIFVCGDVHGKFRDLGYLIKERYRIKDSVICAAGDIGMGFHKPGYYNDEFTRLNAKLVANNNFLFFVRGNHDDPSWFELSHDMNSKFSNIMLVPDYYVLETGGGNILCIGGAISIDRTHRVLGSTYWHDEPCVYNEEALDNLEKKIDIVITHTAPEFVAPFTKDGIKTWFKYDENLEFDCTKERKIMSNIYDRLLGNGHNIKFWVYGHFHMSYSMPINSTMFRCCNELEFFDTSLTREIC